MSQDGRTTIEDAEVARFDAAADIWWDPSGDARWLHRYNPVRVAYIRDMACRTFDRDPIRSDCLRGLRVLDIGCGAGVLCEPLARLGATVVGADPAQSNIRVAAAHALEAALEIDYRGETAEALADAGERFDLVLAMEVVEHVADSGLFLRGCAQLARPGGLVVLSTINRTLKSFVQAIVMGEYVLRLLPRGAHQWHKFMKPEEVRLELERNGMDTIDVTGVTFDLRARALRLSGRTGVNYILTARRTGI
jgi:2-polyprenyl-6-hydroxyphenyl methylase / 3-demethylubiquinone-9 3-methyltransferase